MLGSRAARLTDQTQQRASAKPKPPGSSSQAPPKLSTAQRLRNWFRVTRKLQIVLDAFHYKTCVMHAIGERPYKVIFGHLREEQQAQETEFQRLGVMNILDGQIMGDSLPDSNTVKNGKRTF